MMHWYGDDWSFWQGGAMWIGMIAFWALLIWVIYALAIRPTRESRDAPRQILDRRLARGEIEPEEYTRLCELIDVRHSRDDAAGPPNQEV